MFFDGYADRPRGERAEIEARIAALRLQLWSSPEDKRELEGLIAEAERELRKLEGRL